MPGTSSFVCLGSTGGEAGFFETGGGLGGLFGRTLLTSSGGVSNCNMWTNRWVGVNETDNQKVTKENICTSATLYMNKNFKLERKARLS